MLEYCHHLSQNNFKSIFFQIFSALTLIIITLKEKYSSISSVLPSAIVIALEKKNLFSSLMMTNSD